MKNETLFIKGMVCNRCIKVLNNDLSELGVKVLEVELGRVKFQYDGSLELMEEIKNAIRNNEFEIISSREEVLGEKTRQLIIDYTLASPHDNNLSTILSQYLNCSYEFISRNFSRVYGKTIERFYILVKIERAKQLVNEGNLSFSQIAQKLDYSSLSALSRQFKIETGQSMKEYKSSGSLNLRPLNEL